MQSLTCVRCRARKIRCDRTRPECETCQRDGADCEYSGPGKRVNHIKLLCESVGALDSRVSDLGSKISILAALLESRGPGGQPDGVVASYQEPSFVIPTDSINSVQRHQLVQDRWSGDGLYHRPGSLFASCKSFSKYVHQFIIENGQGHDQVHLSTLLSILCAEVEATSQTTVQTAHLAMEDVRLPPRQVLNMVVNQYFTQSKVDYILDLFIPSQFKDCVTKIYSQRPHTETWAWKVCFNMLILICLGSDHQAGVTDPFLQPYLEIFHTAVANISLLMVPKLINVQVLILLGVLGQRYSSVQLSDSAIAQACVLAQTLGLHQYDLVPQNIGPDEIYEGRKVFRALYIYDITMAISRGSSSWLSSMEFAPPPLLVSQIDTRALASDVLVQLAGLQVEAYRLLNFSAGSSRQLASLLAVERKLNQFATKHTILKTIETNHINDIELRLAFLSTRIYVLSGLTRLSPTQEQQLSEDCRMSLFLVLSSQPAENSATKSRSGRNQSRLASPVSVDDKRLDGAGTESNASEVLTDASPRASLYRLVYCFPVSAMFHLARNVISSAVPGHGRPSSLNVILGLLSALSSQFRSHDLAANRETYMGTLAMVSKGLLQTIAASCSSSQLEDHGSSLDSPDSSDLFRACDKNAAHLCNSSTSWNLTNNPTYEDYQTLSLPDTTLKTPPLFTPLQEEYWQSRGSETRNRKRQRTSIEEQDDMNENSTTSGDHLLGLQDGTAYDDDHLHAFFPRAPNSFLTLVNGKNCNNDETSYCL